MDFPIKKSTNVLFQFGKVQIELSVSADYLVFVNVCGQLSVQALNQTSSIFLVSIF